jgi:hypothetical protein
MKDAISSHQGLIKGKACSSSNPQLFHLLIVVYIYLHASKLALFFRINL